jgi:hypothetical protein
MSALSDLLTVCIVWIIRGRLQREGGRKRNHSGLECGKLGITQFGKPL